MRGLPAAAMILLALAATGAAGGDDPLEKSLKDPDVKVRLSAVRQIGEGNLPDAEDLLLVAVDDRDGEVVERACEGLARKATEKSVRPLAELAIQGSMRRVRLAAAAALGARQPDAGARMVMSGLGAGAKEDFVAACAAEALAEIRHGAAKEKLQASLQANKSPYVRREAAAALGSLRDPALLRDLEAALKDPDLRARAGAVEGIARVGELRAIPLLLSGLQEKNLSDLLERRMISAARRILWARKDDPEAPAAQRKCVDAFRNETKDGPAAARLARLLGSLFRSLPPAPPPPPGEEPKPGESVAVERPARPPLEGPLALEGEGPVGDPGPAVEALGTAGLGHVEPVARRASVAALGRIGGPDAMGHLKIACGADTDDLTRFHALRGWRKWRNARDEETFQLLCDRLKYDKSPLVREEAAVGLGVKDVKGAMETLGAALKDRSWEVAVAAAVSMGKTRDPKAVGLLEPLLQAKDWRLRGAAAAGIGWARRKEGIPILIGALSDAEVSVARTSWEFLKRLVDKDLPPKAQAWADFWAASGEKFEILDREAEIRDAKRYGYALNDRDVYENLDVCVLKSRGDTIQNLLTHLQIKHRLTQSASVKKDGVQPFGVFVSNCTGEMLPDDHERVSWFVHAGGALFASCWAIDTTIGKEFPQTMIRFRGFAGEVLSQAQAEELPTESDYLKGVFPPLVRPIYELWGAYLIEVLDPERLEVLVDSPETGAKFNGCGNLSAWFTAGHGVVMGSSNHFDRQTMTKLQGGWGVSVKTEVERRAFAVDHFGFSWDRIRELDQKGVFARQSDAEKEVVDLSAFRFLTNFVRRKRIVDL